MATAASARPRAEFEVEDAHRFDRRGPVRWIWSHLRRYPWTLAAFLVTVTLASVLISAVRRLVGVGFDAVVGAEPDLQRLAVIAWVILGAVVLRGVVALVRAFCIQLLAQRLERDARDELYASLLGKSQTFHNRQRVGDVMARANADVRQLNPMIQPGVSLIVSAALGIVVPIAFIAQIDARLLVAPALFVATFAVALRRYVAELQPVSGALRRRFGRLDAGLAETIGGVEVVKSTVQEAQEREKFLREAAAYRDEFREQGDVQARYLPPLLVGVALALALAHGLWLVGRGALTVGELVAYLGLMSALRFPADISVFTFALVQLGVAGAERMLELMRAEADLDVDAGEHAEPMRGELEFDGVAFGYQGSGTRALDGVTLRAAPGETIAVVGQTGSGKSTLTKLVNRSYDPTEGSVRIDGVDLRDWDLESLRSQISVIEQDVFLFSRSVAENIAFGARVEGGEVPLEAVRAAAKEAQAHDFIENFADGYDTVLGERGVTLSGGQRQRLAIARALLTDPKILILDDATSAVDSATEDRIQRAIDRVLEGRTTLLITHRLAQIRKADRVVVLERGRLVDFGTHDELMARCALYRRIFARRGS